MVFDGCLGSLDGRFQERVGVAGEFQHHRYLVVLTVYGGLVGHHAAFY